MDQDQEVDAFLGELAAASGKDPATLPPATPKPERIQDPRGALGYVMEGLSRPFQATAAAIKAPEGEKLGAFGRGLVSGAPEAREAVLSDIRGEKPTFGSALAANVVEFVGDTGPAFLLRPGARTRTGKKLVREGKMRGGAPIVEQFEKGARSLTGLRATVPLPDVVNRAVGKVEAPLLRAGGRILQGIGNQRPTQAILDTMNLVFGTKPGSPDLVRYHERLRSLQVDERAARQATMMERILREDTYQRLKTTTGLTDAEMQRTIGLIWERGRVPGTEGAALAQQYPALREFADYMRLSEEGTRTALESLTDAGFLGERGMRERANLEAEKVADPSIGKPPPMAQAKFTPAPVRPGEKLRVYPKEALAIEAAMKAGAATSAGSSVAQLHYGHVARLLTPEGSTFLNVKPKGPGGTGAWIRDVNNALIDPQSKRKAWPDLTLDEINTKARDGTLPGYEGVIAKGPIFEANPLNAATAQALVSGELRSRAKMILDLAHTPTGTNAITGKPTTLGRRLRDFGDNPADARAAAEAEGYVALSEVVPGDITVALSPVERARKKGLVAGMRHGEPVAAERGPFKPAEGTMASTMDEILLPKPVARRLRGTLAWVDPDGWMHKSRALTRAYDDFQGMWAEMTLTPYLFPATTSRNATSEYLNSAFAGTHPVSFGRAMEMVQGIDAPLSNARRLLEKDFDAVDAAREATKSLDHFFGSPEHRQALGDEVGSNAAQRFFGTALRPGGAERLPDGRFLVWDDLPDGTMGQRPMSLLELREQAAALGMTDLGSLREIRTGLKHEADRVKQSTPREYLHSVFGDPTKELSDATLVHRKVHRGIMRYAEEVPRLAQFLEGTIERGLTPKESAAWVRAHHVDTTKPMTWAEKKVFRRAVPFYRWMKFAIPYGFKIALTRPWIPATVAKTMDFLTSGDAEKELTPENVPRYMRKWGLYFPVKIEKDADGKPVVSFVTPQGVVPVFDIMQWTTSWRNAGDSVQRALSPIVQTVKMLGSALDRRGAPISSRTGLPLEGETKYLGFTVDRWVAELLDQWRAVSTIDRYVTENKDTSDILQDPLSTENLTNHFNPFTLRQVDLRASQKQNEGSMAAILMEMQRRGRSELRRLERQGADTTELAEKQKALEVEFRQLMEDLKR